MKRTRVAALLVALGVTPALAGCGGNSSTTTVTSPSSTSPASATTSASGGSADCGQGFTAGRDGVLHVFCDGSASARVTVDGHAATLTGGECDTVSDMFAVNIGVAVGTGFPKGEDRPDYLGIVTSKGSSGALAVTLDGTAYAVAKAKLVVSADKKTVQASGTSLDGKQVSVRVSC